MSEQEFYEIVKQGEEKIARLERFELACQKLWPAVRYFGLCGASPEYIEAVAEIGQLLGKDQAPVAADAIVKARRETIGQVAEVIRNSGEVLAAAGRGLREKLADIVKNLRV